MANNNTFVLFEEIKKQAGDNLQGAKGVERKRRMVLFPSLFNLHQHKVMSRKNRNCSISMNSELKKWLTSILVYKVRIKDEEAKSMDKLVASVLTMLHEWQEKKEHPIPQEHIHRHSFDIKSSKVFTYMVAVSVLCFVSFGRQLLLVAM